LLNPKLQTAEAGSTWIQASDKDFDNGTLNNVTILNSGEEAELAVDLSKLNVWTQKILPFTPGARLNHGMASIWGDDKVLLFGGDSGPDETWIYDLSNNTWTLKSPITKPSPRNAHEMAYIYGDDKVLLFGGYNPYKNDTWVYDLSDDDWTLKSPMNAPEPRGFHDMASVYGDDKVVLFGGYEDSAGNYGDTWIYDLSNDTWTEKSPTNKPDARSSHAMATIYGTDRIFLYGGYPWYEESWVFDVSDGDWTQKSPNTKPNVKFAQKMASIYDTDKIWWHKNRRKLS